MTHAAPGAGVAPAIVAPAAHGPAYHWVRIKRFLSTYGWLAREGLAEQKARLVAVTVASVLGGVAQGAAIGLIVLFVRVIEGTNARGGTGAAGTAGGTGTLAGGWLGNDLGSLVAVAAALVAMQGFAAYSRYYAARHARRIARDFHDRAAASALTLYCDTAGFDAPAHDLTAARICAIIARQPRIMGRALEAMVRSVNPLCSLVIAAAILVAINVTAALVVAPVLLLLMPVLYRVSHRVQRHANAYYETSGRGMSRGVRVCFSAAEHANVHQPCARARVAETWATDPRIRDGLDAFDHVLLSVPRSTLATSIFRPVAIGVVLLVLGYQALNDRIEWALLLAFIAALGQVAGFLEALSGNLAQMNKFYRRVASHRQLVDMLRGVPAPEAAPELPEAIVLSGGGTMTGSAATVTLRRGAPLLCVNPRPVSRATLAAVTEPLARASKLRSGVWHAACFISSAYALPDGPLAASVLGTTAPRDDDVAAIEATLRDLGLNADLDALPHGLHTVLDDETDSPRPSQALETALKVLAIRATDAPLVLIDRGVLRGGNHDFLEGLLACLDDRFVVLLARDRGGWAPRVRHVVAVVDRRIVGMGDLDWWRAHKDEWTPARANRDDDDDNDDDEEDL